jgi:outer membrane protein assembly factor BamB
MKFLRSQVKILTLVTVSSLALMGDGFGQNERRLGSTTPVGQSVSTPASFTNWPTYHRDNVHSGYIEDVPDPQHLTVAWNTRLDGAVYAEPLAIGGHILAATENNTVYSLDPKTGRIDWQAHIDAPVAGSKLPCGNIDPLGITGTPAYDTATGLLFAVAEIAGVAHVLIGIDARNGEIRMRRPVEPPSGNPAAHQQRAALIVSQGMVYVAYGGLYGDCGAYRETVIAAHTDGSGPLLSFQVPTRREGGIWAAAGPATDEASNIFVSVGNGAAESGAWDHSDSVLRLSATLQLEDGFAPDRWAQDNRGDADLGSLGPVVLPGGFIFIAGKAGIGYMLHANQLGGVGGQVSQKPFCHAFGGAATVGNVAFIPCNEGVQELRLGSGGDFTLGWRATETPGSPVVGGNTAYSLDRRGALYALDIISGKVRAKVQVGETSRFATPMLYQNRIFVGTMSGVTAVTGS